MRVKGTAFKEERFDNGVVEEGQVRLKITSERATRRSGCEQGVLPFAKGQARLCDLGRQSSPVPGGNVKGQARC